MTERSVLHVLPHSGAGGEEYVDLLEGMEGFRFERMTLSEVQSPAGALARVPSVIGRARKHDLLHVHGDAAAILCLPAIGLNRSLITLHGMHLVSRSSRLGRRAASAGLSASAKLARGVICVSQWESYEAGLALADFALGRLTVIHNGVAIGEAIGEAEREAARTRLGLAPDELAVAFAGSLDARKDPLTLARAVTAARAEGVEAVALVAGDGPLRGSVASIGPGVRELGPLADLRPLFAAADAFCMPSLREGLSLSLLEAMAAGLPPLVSAAHGNLEAIAEVGLPFAIGDANELGGLLVWLARNPEEAGKLGSAARARVEAEFSAERMRRETREAYLRALD